MEAHKFRPCVFWNALWENMVKYYKFKLEKQREIDCFYLFKQKKKKEKKAQNLQLWIKKCSNISSLHWYYYNILWLF